MPSKGGNGIARLQFIERNNFEVIIFAKEAPHSFNSGNAPAHPQHNARLMDVHDRNPQPFGPSNCGRIRRGMRPP